MAYPKFIVTKDYNNIKCNTISFFHKGWVIEISRHTHLFIKQKKTKKVTSFFRNLKHCLRMSNIHFIQLVFQHTSNNPQRFIKFNRTINIATKAMFQAGVWQCRISRYEPVSMTTPCGPTVTQISITKRLLWRFASEMKPVIIGVSGELHVNGDN